MLNVFPQAYMLSMACIVLHGVTLFRGLHVRFYNITSG